MLIRALALALGDVVADGDVLPLLDTDGAGLDDMLILILILVLPLALALALGESTS